MKNNIIVCKNKERCFSLYCLMATIPLLACCFCLINFKKQFAGISFKGYSSVEPNDPSYSSSWHLPKVEADKAWAITTGRTDVSVGVIDSGIDGSNYDLSYNLTNYDSLDCFSSLRNEPLNYMNKHGTAVATIIGAKGDNCVGFTGVCWDVDMISLRNDDYYGSSNGDAVNTALDYAIDLNIPIINLSSIFKNAQNNLIPIPYIGSSSALYMDYYASQYDGLFVVCAGNQGLDLDNYSSLYPDSFFYPQTFPYSNIIVVGASDQNDNPLSYSNYGTNTVDLFAPGMDISTYPYDVSTGTVPYSFSGTSAAAPMVAGAAALIKSVNPTLTATQIKAAILNNVDYVSGLNGLCYSNGRLNVYKAVKAAIPSYDASFGTTISSVQSLDQNSHQFYKVLLTPGTYSFETTGDLYTSGDLFTDIQSNPVASSNNTSGNFFFNYTTYIDRVVYLKITNNSMITGNYGLKVSQISQHIHSYNASYSWLNQTQHRAFCSCLSSIIQVHAVLQNNPHLCVLCNGYAGSGLIGLPSFHINVGNDSKMLNDGTIVLGITDYGLLMDNEITLDYLIRSAKL